MEWGGGWGGGIILYLECITDLRDTHVYIWFQYCSHSNIPCMEINWSWEPPPPARNLVRVQVKTQKLMRVSWRVQVAHNPVPHCDSWQGFVGTPSPPHSRSATQIRRPSYLFSFRFATHSQSTYADFVTRICPGRMQTWGHVKTERQIMVARSKYSRSKCSLKFFFVKYIYAELTYRAKLVFGWCFIFVNQFSYLGILECCHKKRQCFR